MYRFMWAALSVRGLTALVGMALMFGTTLALQAQSSCATGTAVSDPAGNPGLVEDCEALLAARDQLAVTATLNWSAERAISEWDGVTVTVIGESSRVTELRLSGRQLSGSIPVELVDLTELRYLFLRFNELSGSIPSELGNLTNLVQLYLDGNELSGSIPSELGDLTELKILFLGDNDLSGSIPGELGDLTELTTLRLANNELSGSIPSELGDLTELRILGLDGNELSGSIPRELGDLTELTVLSLAYNELSGSIPRELGNLANLALLYLLGNGLGGSIPRELGNLTNLAQLYLDDNDLSGSIPRELGNLANLALLYLDGNELSGSIAGELGNLANLRWLYLQDNELSGCVPAVLRDRLTEYDFGFLRFCDEGPGKPEPPVVSAASASSLAVSWSAPVNTGAAISDYDVQYRVAASGDAFTDAGFSGTATATNITALQHGTTYEVQVRASSADGSGPWSAPAVRAPPRS